MWTEPGFEALSDEALRVRRIRSAIGVGVAALVLLVASSALAVLDFDLPVPPLAVAAVAIVVIVVGWWQWTRVSWQAWGWCLDEATLQTRSGVYTKVWKGVPRDRVQFVEVTAGPLQRSADLATLVVRTAGVRTPAVHIEDLHAAIAERLRDELSPHANDESVAVRDALADPREDASDSDRQDDLDTAATDPVVTDRNDD